MHGFTSLPMAGHLRRNMHCPVYTFDYWSMLSSLDHNSDRLFDYCQALDEHTVHLVGHSLGGLVVVNMLNRHDFDPPGRVVAIGSPFAHSESGKRFARIPLLGMALGRSITQAHGREPMTYRGEREIGVIIATKPRGPGKILGSMDATHDGIVFADETRLPGAKEILEMPDQTHTTSYFSRQAADRAADFLRNGKF
ncbi:MAG: alpha/beta fold hydrolase [Proteobacteria bacterium]|nr:alpha/beta fold hydrolase [Pseudomonadota bacterium]